MYYLLDVAALVGRDGLLPCLFIDDTSLSWGFTTILMKERHLKWIMAFKPSFPKAQGSAEEQEASCLPVTRLELTTTLLS